MFSKKKFKDKSPEEIKKILDDAFLNVYVDEDKLFNPLEWPPEFADEPHKYITYILSRPEYFHFFCSEILNVDILPFQSVILKEMWGKKFPMLIASRGASKAISPDELVRVPYGWKAIKELKIGENVYGSDGKLCRVTDKTVIQKDLNFYRITFRDGRVIECCEDHQWKVFDKLKNKNSKDIVWSTLKTKDMVDTFQLRRTGKKSNGIENRYAIPINAKIQEETDVDLPIHPYILGVLLGDGSITTKTISFTTQDQEIIDKVQSFLPNKYKLTIKEKENKKIVYIVDNGSDIPFWKILDNLQLLGKKSPDKFIPAQYIFSSSYQKMELIRGLLDTDRCSIRSHIRFYTISDKLRDGFLDIARSLGLACRTKNLNQKRCNNCHRITIYTDQPVFHLSRKLKNIKSKKGLSKYTKTYITNIEYVGKKDGMCITVDSYDHTYITKDYIVTHNSFSLALYSILRAILIPGRKILIASAGFRQSKVIFNYIEKIWERAPLLRDICRAYNSRSAISHNPDMFLATFGDSTITAVPVGPGGDKIRGQRAQDLISDEFNTILKEIFETVMVGFAAVSSDPVANVKELAAKKLLKEFDLKIDDAAQSNKKLVVPNQLVIAGTCGYTFETFYEYWQDWHDIIESKGDPHLLERYIAKKRQSSDMSVEDILENLDYRDYSIIRIPFELIPDGFMDKAQVTRSKATMHSSTYLSEYAAVFPDDSNGFFKRSIINNATCRHGNKISHEGYPDILFTSTLCGDPNKEYIMGIDPASENDNFAIVILELYKNHRRVVYVWTTNKEQQKYEIQHGFTDIHDYYAYCVRKIRHLMKRFNIIRIMLDPEGGGRSIREGLINDLLIEEGEQKIYEVINDDKPKDTDMLEGLHILEMAQFSKADWVAEANNGLRFDIERKILLFPAFDSVTLAIAEGNDLNNDRIYDKLEYCMEEVEELKNELTSIIMTRTPSNRDRWDTPDTVLPGGKKAKQRKDRYSALLIANMGARQLMNKLDYTPPLTIGGLAGHNNHYDDNYIIGNQEYQRIAKQLYDYYG